MKDLKKKNSAKMKTLAELSAVGIQFPVSIAIGFFFGGWLDKLFGTHPVLTMVFSVFGVAAAFVNVFRLNARLTRMEEEESQKLSEEKETSDE